LGDGLFGYLTLEFRRWEAQQTARVALGESALGNELLQVRGELEEANEVEDRRAILAGAVADLLGGEIQFLAQAVEGDGGFDSVEVLALDILDERDLEKAIVGDVPDDYGHAIQASEFGGAPAAFSSDQLIPPAYFPDDDRLNDSVSSNGLGEFGEPLLLKNAPWLQRIGVQSVDWD